MVDNIADAIRAIEEAGGRTFAPQEDVKQQSIADFESRPGGVPTRGFEDTGKIARREEEAAQRSRDIEARERAREAAQRARELQELRLAQQQAARDLRLAELEKVRERNIESGRREFAGFTDVDRIFVRGETARGLRTTARKLRTKVGKRGVDISTPARELSFISAEIEAERVGLQSRPVQTFAPVKELSQIQAEIPKRDFDFRDISFRQTFFPTVGTRAERGLVSEKTPRGKILGQQFLEIKAAELTDPLSRRITPPIVKTALTVTPVGLLFPEKTKEVLESRILVTDLAKFALFQPLVATGKIRATLESVVKPSSTIKIIKPSGTKTPLIKTFADEPVVFVGGKIKGETFDLIKASRAAEKRLLQQADISKVTAKRLDPLKSIREARAREVSIEKSLEKSGLLLPKDTKGIITAIEKDPFGGVLSKKTFITTRENLASRAALKKLQKESSILLSSQRRLGIPREKRLAAEQRFRESGLFLPKDTKAVITATEKGLLGDIISKKTFPITRKDIADLTALKKIQRESRILQSSQARLGIPLEKRLAAEARIETVLKKTGSLLPKDTKGIITAIEKDPFGGVLSKKSFITTRKNLADLTGVKKLERDIRLREALEGTIKEAQMPGMALARARKRFGVDRPITVTPKARPAPIVFDISKDALFKISQIRARVASGAQVVKVVTKGRTTQLLVKQPKLEGLRKIKPKIFEIPSPKEIGRLRSIEKQIGTPRQLIRARQKRLTRLQKRMAGQLLVAERQLERLPSLKTIQVQVSRERVRPRTTQVLVPKLEQQVSQTTSQRQLQQELQSQEQLELEVVRPRQRQRLADLIALSDKVVERQAQPQAQSQPEPEIFKQPFPFPPVTRSRIIQTPRLRPPKQPTRLKPPIPPTERIIIPPIAFGSRRAKRFKAIKIPTFRVEVRRRGKFRPIAGGLPLQRAFGLGTERVGRTLAATFRLIPESDIAGAGMLSPPKGFRRGKKPLTFIERRGRRLSTLGEISEIQLAKMPKIPTIPGVI